MDGAGVFQKTETGEQELQQRTLKLDFKLRSLLILIDGKKTNNQVIKTVGHLGLGLEAFQTLQELGLIEAGSASATGAAAASDSKSAIERYMDGQRYMTGIARDALGIKGLFFKLKIERCSSVQELVALLDEFENMITKKQGAEQGSMARKIAENILVS